MSCIQAVVGGKGVGIADQVTLDIALGCKNECVGCYAKKSSQRGRTYDIALGKNLDKKILKKSIRLVQAKGFQLARIGKHCDPGDHIDLLNGTLECCNDEGFRCVVISKSLTYNTRTADLLRSGKHVLHISLGPYSRLAPPEGRRIATAHEYKDHGVATYIRLTRDITQDVSEIDKVAMVSFDCILTPMRYASMEQLKFYKADPLDFDFRDGYYRPRTTHSSWYGEMDHMCGDVGGTVSCCDCLVDQ